ncbi:hypothetical protein A3C59_04730 [Candidatus Daviesbacteria bacterium RIFCSPHIGHO2_02_FULL_36_13]|uniref:Uncharacterized protein n=1 Tax=Candidatus Daviesbacteria bacterium RIFCSPHIGHO2_02_FULL_36_13 TaxID=1797768 RepID=A0A1F5JNS8_9BACT|nr:MAG: hypothetical protein A3C59_04730 [Candidatus Daviesbacteria bacterium RIFCSPHIGHO2_02_FULL_36_13]
MIKLFLGIFIFVSFLFLNTFSALAQEINCNDRYATIVNPIRSRNLWIDKSLEPLRDQYELVNKYNFPATWLIQFDVLKDKEVLDEIRKFDVNQEMSVLLEVSEKLSEQARVVYPHGTYWYNPKVVFLSGYPQSDRIKIIDKLFDDFKKEFGYYPKSVGAWWIDSYALKYMRNKYGITTAMIVADQKTTDNYGVWGQWWGVPYYPDKDNILTPASNLENKENIVVIQWAQRDPSLAYGEGPIYSNYSLQANDYIRQGKDTEYFADLVNVYLDCKNPLGQITIGLETGIESVGYIDEYDNQLKYLSQIQDLKAVTMNQFAEDFSRVFPQFPEQFLLGSNWDLKNDMRINEKLGDKIKYQQNIAFKDYFTADKNDFLDRNLENLNQKNLTYFPWFMFLIFVAGFVFRFKKLFNLWVIGTLFLAASFGLVLKSNYQMGWEVFYGPVIPYLMVVQIIIIMVSYTIIWFLHRKFPNLLLWLIPLSFGFDFIIKALRFSYFENKYYFGFAGDALRFIGISFSKPFNIEFVNKDFSSVISASLLRFDFSKIWDNLYLSLIAYPLIHIIFVILFGYLIHRLPVKFRKLILAILTLFTMLFLIDIFQADPRLVQ